MYNSGNPSKWVSYIGNWWPKLRGEGVGSPVVGAKKKKEAKKSQDKFAKFLGDPMKKKNTYFWV